MTHLRLASSPWEEMSRYRKARRLADALLDAFSRDSWTLDDRLAALSDPNVRANLLKLCGYEAASPETWGQVHALIQLGTTTAGDPLAALVELTDLLVALAATAGNSDKWGDSFHLGAASAYRFAAEEIRKVERRLRDRVPDEFAEEM